MTRAVLVGLSVVALLGSGLVVSTAGEAERLGETQSAFQPKQGFLVTFVVFQRRTQSSDRSDDQITIIFAEAPLDMDLRLGARRSARSGGAPDPMFGEAIVQEFSFSGLDVPEEGPLVFERIVRDLAFVEAPFIRVVNHGTDQWHGRSLLLEIDGEQVFELEIEPRMCATGEDSLGEGLQNFNRKDWDECVFWEAERSY